MTSARGKRVSMQNMTEFFDDQQEQAFPKVEEVQITNDMKQNTADSAQSGMEQQSTETQEKALIKPDPRPHITSTPLFRYLIIGLVIVAIVVVLIYVVRTYVLRPAEPVPDARDERIREMTDEIIKIKEQGAKMAETVTQLRRENQLQQQTIKHLNEESRFDKDGKQKENSYSFPEVDDTHVPTDKEKVQDMLNKRNRAPEDDHDQEQDHELAVDGEQVEIITEDNQSEDEYEYEDVEEEDIQEPVEEVKIVEVQKKNGKRNSKSKNNKDQEMMNDDDILAIVTGNA